MTPPIRGLTLLHPWGFAVARLNKRDENRGCHPREWGGCVGMYLAIHGAKLPKGEKVEDAVSDTEWIARNFGQIYAQMTPEQQAWAQAKLFPNGGQPTYGDLWTPGIVAVARLAAVRRVSSSLWARRGAYIWQLADVLPVGPLPYIGAPRLWEIEGHTLGLLRERWAQAHDGEVRF